MDCLRAVMMVVLMDRELADEKAAPKEQWKVEMTDNTKVDCWVEKMGRKWVDETDQL
jgi:hypothetical protein